MMRTIFILATAGLLVASAVQAQNNPPPGNVNPGSLQSGAEESGAENQPRSQNGGAMQGIQGTTGAAPRGDRLPRDEGINATVNPGSKESGSEPAGEPASQRR